MARSDYLDRIELHAAQLAEQLQHPASIRGDPRTGEPLASHHEPPGDGRIDDERLYPRRHG
jgi:hypothetical protein